jgi:hypothetical protein
MLIIKYILNMFLKAFITSTASNVCVVATAQRRPWIFGNLQWMGPGQVLGRFPRE